MLQGREHLQESDLSLGHGPFVAVGHGMGWCTSTPVSIRMLPTTWSPRKQKKTVKPTCLGKGEETFLGLTPHPIFVLKNHAKVVRTQQILSISMTAISLQYPKS